MNKCPKCGRYMMWHIAYSNGMPYEYWSCECKYDTREEAKNIKYSNSTQH